MNFLSVSNIGTEILSFNWFALGKLTSHLGEPQALYASPKKQELSQNPR